MKRDFDVEMSELEKEYELSMSDDVAGEAEPMDDQEFEYAYERSVNNDFDTDRLNGYGERLYELSLRRFQTESEIDESVNEILNEMERDFFFKGLWKKVKKGGKALLKKGWKIAKGLPIMGAVKGITQLARGNLKGMLGSLAKAGLSAASGAVPGGAMILPALKGLGFETSEDPSVNRDAWNNYVTVANESFNYLASSLNENADDPLEASRLANESFRTGLKRIQSGSGLSADGGHRVFQLRKGDTIILKVV